MILLNELHVIYNLYKKTFLNGHYEVGYFSYESTDITKYVFKISVFMYLLVNVFVNIAMHQCVLTRKFDVT